MSKAKFSNKLLSLLVVVSMIFSFFGTAFASTDVKGHWAEKEINEWMEKGLMKGFEDGTFKPNNSITRAEFVTLVNQSFQFTDVATEGFNDVTPSDWYYQEVLKAKASGYINGYEDGTFKPNMQMTRQEVAAVIARLLNLETSANGIEEFKDKSDIPNWSKGVIGSVVEKGFMRGFEDGTFKPLNHLTRAEAVVSLNRVLGGSEQETKAVAYNQTGTYGPANSVATIQGNVSISASDVTLQNTVIEGNLTIEESVGNGNVYLKGVTVKGETFVKGGGENSIHFEDTILVTVIVNKANGTVRIVASGKTTVQQVELQSSAKVEEANTTEAAFQAITLAENLPENSLVTLIGDFDSVEIKATTIAVSIPKGSIKDLKVDEKAKGTSIDVAKDAKIVSLVVDAAIKVVGEGKIENAKVNSNGASFAQKPDKVDLASGITTKAGGQNVSQSTTSGGGGGGPTTPSNDDDDDDSDEGDGGPSTTGDTIVPIFKSTDVWVTEDNKNIVIPYSENIIENVDNLKNNVQIARNGTSFTNLDEEDTVWIGTEEGHKNSLIITLNTSITGNETKIKVLANTIKDAAGNVQKIEQITGAIASHQTIPGEPTTADSIEVSLEYLGHSAFIMTTEEKKILIDPWNPGGFQLPAYTLENESEINLITLTHLHGDHSYVDAAPTARDAEQIVQGITIDDEWNQAFNQINNANYGDVAISSILLNHFPDLPEFNNFDGSRPIENSGFIYQTANMRIVNMGDAMGSILDGLSSTEINTLKGSEGIDILIIPVGNWTGYQGLNPSKVIEAIEDLNPKVVIPVHSWETKQAFLDIAEETFTVESKQATLTFDKNDLPTNDTVIWNMDSTFDTALKNLAPTIVGYTVQSGYEPNSTQIIYESGIGNVLMAIKHDAAITAPEINSTYLGNDSIDNYVSGMDILDVTPDMHIGLYEVKDHEYFYTVEKFVDITLTEEDIAIPAPTISESALTIEPGSLSNSTKITYAPGGTNSLKVIIGDEFNNVGPTMLVSGGTIIGEAINYTSGTDINDVQDGKIIRLYEVDADEKIVKYIDIELTADQIKP